MLEFKLIHVNERSPGYDTAVGVMTIAFHLIISKH